MDSLSTLLQNMNFNAEVFFSGKLCGLQVFEEEQQSALLHFIKAGEMSLSAEPGYQATLKAGSVIFIPDGTRHRFKVEKANEVELVCANINFPAQERILLIRSLPKFVSININQNPDISKITQWLFKEAFNSFEGRHIMINRLCDLFMVQMLRYVMDEGIVELGTLSGEMHPRLSALMTELKNNPAYDWKLEEMAANVAMSRSKFASFFKEIVGLAPMEYVTELRLTKAQTLLKQNKAVGLVANEVGYENASSLAKVFNKRFKLTPKQWLKAHRDLQA